MPSHLGNHTLFSTVYGQGVYSCGAYEVGCATTTVSPPDTSALLTEPSIAIPGSLLLAVIVALITTSVIKLIRRRTARKND
jgi:hypothetical protein